jgi:hypothetical protein
MTKKISELPNKEELHRMFDYQDGNLYWKIKVSNSINIGDKVSCFNKKSNKKRITINNKCFMASRIIYAMFYNDPKHKSIIHIDLDKNNLKIENLKVANNTERVANVGKKSNNTSGFRGVSGPTPSKKWRVNIGYLGKRYHIGTYENKEIAHKAYCEKAKELFGKFARIDDA